jgi:hypothetical protein
VSHPLEVFLGFSFRRSIIAAILGLAAPVCLAQNPPQVTLDTNETLFTILASINACGYDEQLKISDPVRSQIRAEIARAVHASVEAQETANVMCTYYHEHIQPDPGRTLAQYVSLGLLLNGPPTFLPKMPEGDMPPDVVYVVGFAKLATTFYEKAGLHNIWQRHRDVYNALTERYHAPVSKMLFDTEIYLKLPSSGYLGREFTVLLEPMGAPDQENARNYGPNYYVVISPAGSTLKVDQIRHTYLHYLLDPLALKYGAEMKRLDPLKDSVKRAPMDDAFKTDMALLVTESMIRAVEIRMQGAKAPEQVRLEGVQQSTEQGFILTRYFYDTLAQFEKDPAGIRSAYSDMLANIDVKKEAKRASEVQFASQASPELLHLSRKDVSLLQIAEKRLATGDLKSAQELAQQALTEKQGDQGRALFIMAQVATANRDMEGAQSYFEQALKVAQEPKVVAWSHIYLGRIFDLKENRDAAVSQYRDALNSGGTLPEVKAAAERGLQKPYEPPSQSQEVR